MMCGAVLVVVSSVGTRSETPVISLSTAFKFPVVYKLASEGCIRTFNRYTIYLPYIFEEVHNTNMAIFLMYTFLKYRHFFKKPLKIFLPLNG